MKGICFMTKTIVERNAAVTAYLNKLYLQALNLNYICDNSFYLTDLCDIFYSKTISYREIILVVIVGRELDHSFQAYSNFYGCKPRAIFEGPIKEFLLVNGFPHTKSGPLNIAKASNINENWSLQRIPQEDAIKVVNLIKLIDNSTKKLQDDIGTDLIRQYIKTAMNVKKLEIKISPTSDPTYLANLCINMINKAPDAGNTPQKIVGYLLATSHAILRTGILVSGTEDSASTTSTTSKKPGDINEESIDGQIYKVYEITIKPFNLSRIKDSYDCINKYNQEHGTLLKEVIVICRRQDCPPDLHSTGKDFCMGSYIYQDVIYYYWDIYEWIIYMLQHMIEPARKEFYLCLNNYINNPNTHQKVKEIWKDLHSQHTKKS